MVSKKTAVLKGQIYVFQIERDTNQFDFQITTYCHLSRDNSYGRCVKILTGTKMVRVTHTHATVNLGEVDQHVRHFHFN